MENVSIVLEEIMNSQVLERFPELTLKPEDSALYLLAYLSTHSIKLLSSTENSPKNLFFYFLILDKLCDCPPEML